MFTAPGDICFLAMVVLEFCVGMEDLENPVQQRDVGVAGGKFLGVGLKDIGLRHFNGEMQFTLRW